MVKTVAFYGAFFIRSFQLGCANVAQLNSDYLKDFTQRCINQSKQMMMIMCVQFRENHGETSSCYLTPI